MKNIDESFYFKRFYIYVIIGGDIRYQSNIIIDVGNKKMKNTEKVVTT